MRTVNTYIINALFFVALSIIPLIGLLTLTFDFGGIFILPYLVLSLIPLGFLISIFTFLGLGKQPNTTIKYFNIGLFIYGLLILGIGVFGVGMFYVVFG